MTGTWRLLSICLFVGIPVGAIIVIFSIVASCLNFLAVVG